MPTLGKLITIAKACSAACLGNAVPGRLPGSQGVIDDVSETALRTILQDYIVAHQHIFAATAAKEAIPWTVLLQLEFEILQVCVP